MRVCHLLLALSSESTLKTPVLSQSIHLIVICCKVSAHSISSLTYTLKCPRAQSISFNRSRHTNSSLKSDPFPQSKIGFHVKANSPQHPNPLPRYRTLPLKSCNLTTCKNSNNTRDSPLICTSSTTLSAQISCKIDCLQPEPNSCKWVGSSCNLS